MGQGKSTPRQSKPSTQRGDEVQNNLITSGRSILSPQTGMTYSQVYPMSASQALPQTGENSTTLNKQRTSVMVTPMMPISLNANPEFPWTENILYPQGDEETANLEPGQPVPDVLEGVQIPFLKRKPINMQVHHFNNFQEYKEYLAKKQGISLPQNSITSMIETYQKTGWVPRQSVFLSKQLRLHNLVLPAYDHPDPVYFWCPVCEKINQTEIVKNGCFPNKLRTTKNIRSDKTLWEKDKKTLCLLFMCPGPGWVIASCIFCQSYYRYRDTKVHLCQTCKRVVGAHGNCRIGRPICMNEKIDTPTTIVPQKINRRSQSSR